MELVSKNDKTIGGYYGFNKRLFIFRNEYRGAL